MEKIPHTRTNNEYKMIIYNIRDLNYFKFIIALISIMSETAIKMYIVVSTDNNYICTILKICETPESAIAYLTSHIDYQYETSINNKYRVVQKSQKLFEVYQNGYLGKYFTAKYQVIEVKP
jgi:hypothetical protein